MRWSRVKKCPPRWAHRGGHLSANDRHEVIGYSSVRFQTEEEAAAAIAREHGLDLEDIRAAREREQRAAAEHEAGYLGNGQATAWEAMARGRIDTALAGPDAASAALTLLRDPAFIEAIRKSAPATVDVLCKRLRSVGIKRASVDAAVGSEAPSVPKVIGRPDPVPAHESQSTSELVSELVTSFGRHLVLPEGATVALALWAMHTWVLPAARHSPRLALTSPTKRCGKSTVLDVLDLVCRRSLRTASVSAAALYRAVELAQPALLVDEADSFLAESEELRGVLNAGYDAGGYVLRCTGDEHEPKQFRCFAPVALAAIGDLPGTVADRAITIRMVRKTADAKVARLDRHARETLLGLRPRLARWASDARHQLEDAFPELPGRLNDRQRDICAPLIAIADLAGGEWPSAARDALVKLYGASEGDAADVRERALAAVWSQYADGAAFISLKALVETMLADDAAGWNTAVRGRPLDTGTLARWVKAYDLSTERPRSETDPKRPRGYPLEAVRAVARRYLNQTEPEGGNGGPGGPHGPAPTCADAPSIQPTDGPPVRPVHPKTVVESNEERS